MLVAWGFMRDLPTSFQKAANSGSIFRGLSPPVSPRRAVVSQYTFRNVDMRKQQENRM